MFKSEGITEKDEDEVAVQYKVKDVSLDGDIAAILAQNDCVYFYNLNLD